MEIVVDFGLFELFAMLVVARESRKLLARRRRRMIVASLRAKLGRCARCMTMAGLGASASGVAILFVDPHTSHFVRFPIYLVGALFFSMASLHLVAMLYHGLVRLEERVSGAVGGCNCGARPQTPRRAAHGHAGGDGQYTG